MRLPHLLRHAFVVALALLASSVSAKPARPIPEIASLAPNAHVAVVQGSTHWVHLGHLELIDRVAKAKGKDGKPADLVVVLPTRIYDRKPFLRATYARRLQDLRTAIAERPELKGRVIVSDGMTRLPAEPAKMLGALLEAYPSLRFSYSLGADSFNDSARWPGFAEVSRDPRLEVVAVTRPGHPIADRSRAARVLTGRGTAISSTEIRDALEREDLTSIASRVPAVTLRGLELELARRRATEPTGTRLLPGPRHSYRSFAQLSAERPATSPDLVSDLDQDALPEPVRDRLATLQERLNLAHADLAKTTLRASAQQLDQKLGYTDKLVLDAKRNRKPDGKYLWKRFDWVSAKKVEALTTLANALGLATPLGVAQRWREPGARDSIETGLAMRMIEDVESTREPDFVAMSPRVREGLLVSRWFNQLIGNQDVWWGQFLRPRSASRQTTELLNIDFDNAWVKRDPRVVRAVLKNHFDLEVPLTDTAWTNRTEDLDSKVGWAPEHYDSRFTMYGPLLADYVMGRIDLDLDKVKAEIRASRDVPKSVTRKIMAGYLDAASAHHWGAVPLQAADRFLAREEFARGFEARLERSVEEYCSFLDELKSARQDPRHPMHVFYSNLGARY